MKTQAPAHLQARQHRWMAFAIGLVLAFVLLLLLVMVPAVRSESGAGMGLGPAGYEVAVEPQAVSQSSTTMAQEVVLQDYWALVGNAGLTSTHFLGTTDSVTLTLAVSGTTALRIAPSAGIPNIIGGYEGNTAQNDREGITISGGGSGGGYENRAYGAFSTVGGGIANQAGDPAEPAWYAVATVGGGNSNGAIGRGSTVAGGHGNNAAGIYASISGGNSNTAGGQFAVEGGGYQNDSLGDYSVVAGGQSNSAGYASTVSGGESNSAWGSSTVSGGELNYADRYNVGYSTVGGGYSNTSVGDYATVAGGWLNYVEVTTAGTIGGGYDNQVLGDYATIGGGIGNEASGSRSTVAGGKNNLIQFIYGNSSTIGGGEDNSISGNYATIPGGFQNSASGHYSLAAGSGAQALHDGAFVWADSGATLASTAPNQFLIKASGGVGIGTNAPGAALAVTGGGQPVYIDSRTAATNWQNYIGFNVYHDGANWIARGDSVHNAGALIRSGWGNGDLVFSTFGNTGGAGQVVAPGNDLVISGSGNVGIGTNPTDHRLTVASSTADTLRLIGPETYGVGAQLNFGDLNEVYISEPTDRTLRLHGDNGIVMSGGNVGVVENLMVAGDTWTQVLHITGGDLAEPFAISGNPEPGTVVSIDPENPGQFRPSSSAHDRLVAGCVSGANDLQPGIIMYEEALADDNTFPVALSGRVYCWADATYGTIQPGDFLTTSGTPGHVMAVSDYESAQGAIVGKAMTGLESGTGLVLVLVTLQ